MLLHHFSHAKGLVEIPKRVVALERSRRLGSGKKAWVAGGFRLVP